VRRQVPLTFQLPRGGLPGSRIRSSASGADFGAPEADGPSRGRGHDRVLSIRAVHELSLPSAYATFRDAAANYRRVALLPCMRRFCCRSPSAALWREARSSRGRVFRCTRSSRVCTR
jgi:hypothetical protein